ncbi:MAG: hypothetical protein HQ481_13855 [Alphaproteobacteria bacterium]|nr:hypothetical protein [Alphaproteobacteria bacterium]
MDAVKLPLAVNFSNWVGVRNPPALAFHGTMNIVQTSKILLASRSPSGATVIEKRVFTPAAWPVKIGAVPAHTASGVVLPAM